MRKARFGGLLASTALAGATILGGAGIASAQDTGPVTFDAVDVGDCTVEFTLENRSTSTAYQIDYQINGEFDTDDQTWHEAGHVDAEQGDEDAATRWGPTSTVDEDVTPRGEDGAGHHSWDENGENYPWSTATQKVDLKTLEGRPDTNEDGSYTIEYRLIWGPDTSTRFDHEKPRTLTVTDCKDDPFGSVKGSANLPDFNLDSLRANLSS